LDISQYEPNLSLLKNPNTQLHFKAKPQARKREDQSIEFLIVCYENQNLQKKKKKKKREHLVFWSQVRLPSFRVAQLSIVCTVWGTVECLEKREEKKTKLTSGNNWKLLVTPGVSRGKIL
jgi:hypothetical protein